MSHVTPRHTSFARRLVRALRVGFVAGLLGGCAPPSENGRPVDDQAIEEDAIGTATTYVDLEGALPTEHDRARWTEIRARLDRDFDDICGDTFCEGDWSNLEPIDLACSATAKRGEVRECVWSFAASEEVVDAGSGEIHASIPFFTCRFRPGGTARQLVAALHEDPLRAPLPGFGASIYDRLGDCFEEPEGASDLTETLDGPYVDVSSALQTDAEVEAWYEMIGALRDDWAAEVAEDDGAPRPLRFRCSEDQNTRQIGSCAWSFAGAEALRRRDGIHRVAQRRSDCSFTPVATAAELAAALAPGASDVAPIDRALPGRDQSLREVLAACL